MATASCKGHAVQADVSHRWISITHGNLRPESALLVARGTLRVRGWGIELECVGVALLGRR